MYVGEALIAGDGDETEKVSDDVLALARGEDPANPEPSRLQNMAYQACISVHDLLLTSWKTGKKDRAETQNGHASISEAKEAM